MQFPLNIVEGCLFCFCHHGVILKLTKLNTVCGHCGHRLLLDICTPVTPEWWYASPEWLLDENPIHTKLLGWMHSLLLWMFHLVSDIFSWWQIRGNGWPGQGFDVSNQELILHYFGNLIGIGLLQLNPWSIVLHRWCSVVPHDLIPMSQASDCSL